LTSEEASLEDIDVSGLGVEQRQYALIYPARKRAMQAQASRSSGTSCRGA